MIKQFTSLASDNPRLRFLGNVRVGRDASLAELRGLYNGVVLAYGAESDRRLGVPGEVRGCERGRVWGMWGLRAACGGPPTYATLTHPPAPKDLPGVLSAREFVWWYNGHPDYARLPVDLRNVRSVAIAGLGNVAVDCARLLLRPPRALAGTDVAAHALRALRESAVEEVHLIGRRGPAQVCRAACFLDRIACPCLLPLRPAPSPPLPCPARRPSPPRSCESC